MNAWWATCLVAVSACAPAGATSVAPGDRLPGTDEALHAIAPRADDTSAVLIFFSADCHVLRAHDERLRALAADYTGRGVRFWAVDSEVGATIERDRAEVAARRYGFPILIDRGARVARAFGAEFAGHAIVLDSAGRVVYRGGIDSDRVHLTDDATSYLRNALDDVLAGRAPRVAESKSLGCALRLQ